MRNILFRLMIILIPFSLILIVYSASSFNDELFLSILLLLLGLSLLHVSFKALGYQITYFKHHVGSFLQANNQKQQTITMDELSIDLDDIKISIQIISVQFIIMLILFALESFFLERILFSFVALFILILLSPRLFGKRLLGSTYHNYLALEVTKPKQDITYANLNSYYIPLKKVMTKIPSPVLNQYFQETYDIVTTTLGGSNMVDFIDISTKSTMLSMYQDSNLHIVLEDDKKNTLVKIGMEALGKFTLDSELDLSLERKNILSREIKVYKKEALWFETKVIKHDKKTYFAILLKEDEDDVLAVALSCGIVYSMFL